MDVHVRDLRYFLAVAEHGQVTGAAEALFLSQPALSKQVRALERRLGTSLFERDAHGVALTRAGADLLPHARAVVDAWEAAERSLDRRACGTLVVGMQTSPGRGLLPAVRAQLAERCPEARLELRQIGWADPTAGLGDESADAAFVWLPLPDAGRLGWVPIAREPRLVALPSDHRLADAGTVTMADLLDEPFLALPPSAGAQRDFWLAVDARDGRPARVTAEIGTTEETYEAVATGLGVCLLAAGNAPFFDRGGVVVLPVTDLGPADYVLAFARGRRSPLVDAFVRICADVAVGAAA
jgi:DNA-binding transcriptional LysR family regulator